MNFRVSSVDDPGALGREGDVMEEEEEFYDEFEDLELAVGSHIANTYSLDPTVDYAVESEDDE